jgi:hypothetical protein
MKLKTIKNDLKSAAQCWAEIGLWLQRVARRPATRGRPEGLLGHGLAAWSSRRDGLRAGRRGGALAGGPVVASRWQGIGLEHHGRAADTSGKGSGGGAHRCGAAMLGRSGGSMRLAPGATGEDEGGEGGSKTGSGGGLVGLTMGGGGGNGDGGGRKSVGEGRGGSVTIGGREESREGAVEERTWHTDVDLRDGAKSGTGDGWRPFYGGPVARQRERVGGLARCRVEGKNGKGRGGPGAAWDNAAARQRPIAAQPQCQAVAPVDRRSRAA